MDILQRDLPARFDTGASGGPSPGDAMALALTAFEARMDMLERTRVASDGAPRALRVKKPEERWEAVLEDALHIHRCVDDSRHPLVSRQVQRTPVGGRYHQRIRVCGARLLTPPPISPPASSPSMPLGRRRSPHGYARSYPCAPQTP